MRLAIASDHGGYALKAEIAAKLRASSHDVRDFGAHASDRADDYPDCVIPLARALAVGDIERGIALAMRDKLIEHKHFIDEHGEDMPEIRNWKWTSLA